MLYTKCYHEKLTLKPLLFCTALAGMALQGTIKAQDITFRAAENEEAEAIGVNTSDGVPVVADFDNNGLWIFGHRDKPMNGAHLGSKRRR